MNLYRYDMISSILCISPLLGHEAELEDVALVSGSADKTAKVWKKNAAGKWVNSATLEGHTGAVEAIGCLRSRSISGTTDLFATGSADGTIRIWERKVVDDANGNFHSGPFFGDTVLTRSSYRSSHHAASD